MRWSIRTRLSAGARAAEMSLELALKVDQEPQNRLLHTTQVFNAVIALSGIANAAGAPDPVRVRTGLCGIAPSSISVVGMCWRGTSISASSAVCCMAMRPAMIASRTRIPGSTSPLFCDPFGFRFRKLFPPLLHYLNVKVCPVWPRIRKMHLAPRQNFQLIQKVAVRGYEESKLVIHPLAEPGEVIIVGRQRSDRLRTFPVRLGRRTVGGRRRRDNSGRRGGEGGRDTLVIDTVGIRIGPFAAVDIFSTPYTEALHVVERYRLQPLVKEPIPRMQKAICAPLGRS
jgi:hypothetical protein